MLCTFCGTENHPESKFCGMCGVRLERRQLDRRARQETLKCASCGHINDLGYKFCAMCGSRVDRRMRERRSGLPEQPRASAIANVQLPPPEAPVRRVEKPIPPESSDKSDAAPSAESAPHAKTSAIFRSETPRFSGVSGPSILGLGDEPQNSAEYLLEDDGGSSGSMLRRLVLIAILAAIAGLIFVGWRSTFFRANPKASPPAPAAPVASPSAPPSASPLPQGKDQQDPPSDPDPSTKTSESPSIGDAHGGAKDLPAHDKSSSSKTPVVVEEKAATGGARHESRGKKADRRARPAVPNDAPSSEHRASAALLRAQQYLQGRGGVRQNCEQGLMYLKAATDKNEPAAAVQMGALYASGHCVQRNEVMAYRWFNSAHELDPANPWIQANLDQIWRGMTAQQRRQVSQ
jgi:hypothetical protein